MSKIPRGFPPEKKTGHKPDDEHHKENIPRKNGVSKTVKGVSTRYGQEAELREQNQNLRVANDDLQKNLTQTQQKVTELQQQYSDLEKEKLETEKHLKDCHALLVSAKIDPVLGERVGEAAQENEEQRKEVMTVSTELLNELKTFADIATEQCSRLQEIQSTLCELTKAQEQMRQERESFAVEAADLEKALNEAEALLL
ncbi:small kinetochore-associated protein isoform X2 [Boleophthalmus pectinirostris]|uniref:small kinetochore-associated protein isoform X2 n=1 Tax=Boleophthalmus pectinirostris TaxID=150288 RepID=UPI002431603F|nr:small kinetochore-associated protein isoform X2 [Boleophthalmus pectinirostris]